MAKEMVWRFPLDGEDDIAVLRLVVERGKVVEFALVYSTLIRGREVEVVRYDTCHGHLHVHRMWLDGPNERVALGDPHAPLDYSDAVERTRADLMSNWRSYRARMVLKE